MKKAKVFEETYSNYLSELAKIDIKERAHSLGAEKTEAGLIIPFYNSKFSVSEKGIFSQTGNQPSFAVKVVLCKYVLMCPQIEVPDGSPLVTYREFKSAGPLTSFFTSNTNKIIESTFAGSFDLLRESCLDAGGVEKDSDSYDLSMEMMALPNIPVVLNFNDADDMFPAGCSILYRASAERYLDMECLAITGTYLTGLLI